MKRNKMDLRSPGQINHTKLGGQMPTTGTLLTGAQTHRSVSKRADLMFPCWKISICKGSISYSDGQQNPVKDVTLLCRPVLPLLPGPDRTLWTASRNVPPIPRGFTPGRSILFAWRGAHMSSAWFFLMVYSTSELSIWGVCARSLVDLSLGISVR
jgi:hypothetical protein